VQRVSRGGAVRITVSGVVHKKAGRSAYHRVSDSGLGAIGRKRLDCDIRMVTVSGTDVELM
jgi:hypothetical protein